MSRLTLVDPDNLTGERKAQYDRFPSNLTGHCCCWTIDSPVPCLRPPTHCGPRR